MNETDFLPENRRKNLLQQTRIHAGLTQETASGMVDCGTRTLHRYEGGKAIPPFEVMCHLACAYNCEVADMFPNHIFRANCL